jgi:hypothetical protein
MHATQRLATPLILILLGCTPACSSDDDPVRQQEKSACQSFDSTFEAIQKRIFERHGCTATACHGSSQSGGLDLRAAASYESLLETKSEGSALVRVQPGAPKESYLYLKLAAATDPDSGVQIANSPMPVGRAPLSKDELEAVRLWIQGGAPKTGAVGDPTRKGTSDTIGDLLSACLPQAGPVQIAPLEAPSADEGIQFRAPPWVIAPGKEREVCVATYYDFSERIPDAYKSPDGTKFYTNGSRLRQDPASHHYVIANPLLDVSHVNDPSFGSWTCYGGDAAGEACNPLDVAACAGGVCGSELKDALACIGFGPQTGPVGSLGTLLGEGLIENVQATNQYLPPREGVYRELPIRGFLYHNAHAFNLTEQDYVINSRLNVYYAKDRRRRMQQVIDYTHLSIGAGTAPFTVKEVCANYVAPAGAELIRLTSHTHKRGKRFWVTVPSGDMIYESFLYSDPLYKEYDPALLFNGASPADRTLRACAVYNNGVAEDGSPDPEAVTRLSRMPERATCAPVACVSGRVAAPCNGPDDDATCDSAPGAGDGECDACPITGGVTTENEMFVVMPWYVLPEGQ